MTFDQLEDFGELMKKKAALAGSAEEAKEYETVVKIVEELLASREQFGAVADSRFLIG